MRRCLRRLPGVMRGIPGEDSGQAIPKRRCGVAGPLRPARRDEHDMGQQKYLSRIPIVYRRSTDGGRERPGV